EEAGAALLYAPPAFARGLRASAIAVKEKKNRTAARRRRIPGHERLIVARSNVFGRDAGSVRRDHGCRRIIDEAVRVECECAAACGRDAEEDRDSDQEALEHRISLRTPASASDCGNSMSRRANTTIFEAYSRGAATPSMPSLRASNAQPK